MDSWLKEAQHAAQRRSTVSQRLFQLLSSFPSSIVFFDFAWAVLCSCCAHLLLASRLLLLATHLIMRFLRFQGHKHTTRKTL